MGEELDALWAKVMNGDDLTREEIRLLRDNALKKLKAANRMHEVAVTALQTIEKVCKHPGKKGYVCPDCGLDDGPDGF